MQHSAVRNHHRAEHGPLFMRESGDSAVRGEESGLYVVRDLPRMYTHELMALELLHHGCGLGVAFLDVPLDPEQLNQGYALVRFTDAQAAQDAVRVLQGAGFSLAPAALPMSITPVELPGSKHAPRVFSYSALAAYSVPESVPEVESVPQELEQMLLELTRMQEQVAQPLPRSGRFAGLDIAVEEVRVPLSKHWVQWDAPTVSTACSDSSPRIPEETPVKGRGAAITPPTRSTSCSSAGSSPRLPVLAWAPDAPFALPCLLPSPASCRAIAQGC